MPAFAWLEKQRCLSKFIADINITEFFAIDSPGMEILMDLLHDPFRLRIFSRINQSRRHIHQMPYGDLLARIHKPLGGRHLHAAKAFQVLVHRIKQVDGSLLIKHHHRRCRYGLCHGIYFVNGILMVGTIYSVKFFPASVFYSDRGSSQSLFSDFRLKQLV